MRVFAVFSAVAIVSACVANTVPAQNATLVQKSTWRTENFREPSVNTGLLIINRDTVIP